MHLTRLRALSTALVFAIACLSFGAPVLAIEIRKSGSNICHCPGNRWYDRTTSFTAYGTIEQCLSSGGRQAKEPGQCHGGAAGQPSSRQSASSPQASTRQPSHQTSQVRAGAAAHERTETQSAAPARQRSTSDLLSALLGGGAAAGAGAADGSYDRDEFGGWRDDDRDCVNTRHEMLAALNTGNLTVTRDRCAVVTGRWIDPYTDRIFTQARDLDIDHLVPLAYAWSRGADGWSPARRAAFANDPVNLFAVDAGANRAKGAKGPTEWMPPSVAFHCQYLLRFQRVVQTYKLSLSSQEDAEISHMRKMRCGR